MFSLMSCSYTYLPLYHRLYRFKVVLILVSFASTIIRSTLIDPPCRFLKIPVCAKKYVCLFGALIPFKNILNVKKA